MPTTPSIPVTIGHFRVPDADLYYEVRGAGPPVVLIGCPMDAGSFAPLANLTARHHRQPTARVDWKNRSADHMTGDGLSTIAERLNATVKPT